MNANLLETEIRHGRNYDPIKAHEYYLRTRHLKGRRGGSNVDISSRPGGQGGQGGTGGSSNKDLRPSRSKDLDRQIEELNAKIDRLRDLLDARVKKAKERAGVDEPESKDKKSSSKETKKESKSAKDSKDKPLTEKQKAEKRKASKEQYEKENGTSKAREVEALKNVVKNLRERLAKLQKPENNQAWQGSNQTARRPLTSNERS